MLLPLLLPRVRRFSVLLWPVLPLAMLTASAPPARPPHLLQLRLNGVPVKADTTYSRIEVSTGAGKVLTLAIARADAPDEQGLTILVDEFKPTPGIYRFKEILSGHVREAGYRVGDMSAESMACGVNEGEVRVTNVDAAQHLLTGTFRVVLCQTNVARSAAKRLVFEGVFHYPYEVR
ncbi:hypothetical protein F0P96_11260 [Hymenobacter busanensis]|uniref:Uncharacterized protein n=1 Tax=Hymenobacter busanensis TaxID=2607656 RepID=A0A7L4ZWJ8_9BACT|nr:hypothetical protein [Hymenobacter busanensis]KAA9332061.1 hypothetical protein F0P96_11260 [Hymenobacter busanensis]QHJ07601.1 hypothetical protein GUY19_10015 [Hymenobacter busanensis]